MTHHEYNTSICLHADCDPCPVIVAIIGYEPPEAPTRTDPGSPGECEIEIRDVSGRPRPDWEATVGRDALTGLARAADADWQDTVDAEYREAAADGAAVMPRRRYIAAIPF